jgi:hypothetical protein
MQITRIYASSLHQATLVSNSYLKGYTRLAPEVIGDRWGEDRKLLKREEAAELLRVDSGLSEEHKATLPVRNEHFLVPRIASRTFTGRAEVAQRVRQKFFTTGRRSDDSQHKIFVLWSRWLREITVLPQIRAG